MSWAENKWCPPGVHAGGHVGEGRRGTARATGPIFLGLVKGPAEVRAAGDLYPLRCCGRANVVWGLPPSLVSHSPKKARNKYSPTVRRPARRPVCFPVTFSCSFGKKACESSRGCFSDPLLSKGIRSHFVPAAATPARRPAGRETCTRCPFEESCPRDEAAMCSLRSRPKSFEKGKVHF